jgi:cytochrome P450
MRMSCDDARHRELVLRRLTNRVTELGPYKIPSNVMVYVLFYRLHNNGKLWRDPHEFLPERWAEQAEEAPAGKGDAAAPAPSGADVEPLARNDKTFLPFSEGPRGCLGQVRPSTHITPWRRAWLAARAKHVARGRAEAGDHGAESRSRGDVSALYILPVRAC